MEFPNRAPQSNPVRPAEHHEPSNRSSSQGSSKRFGKGDWSHTKIYRLVQGLLMLCVLIVVVGLLVFLALNDNTYKSESSYIDGSKLQAVFLNTGQVYFGNIKSLNNNYLVLTNIFYLQTSSASGSSSSSSANTSVSLVKLGCEIHAPLDQMVINRTSVTFWENLSASGQVAKAVSTWEKDNPDGQKCSDQSTAGTSGQSTPQNATNNTSTGTNSSTSGTK